jgi:PAS domain S-box-containing protein
MCWPATAAPPIMNYIAGNRETVVSAMTQGNLTYGRSRTPKGKLPGESLWLENEVAEHIFAAAQTVILILDTQGRIVTFNPYMRRLCGYRLGEVKGKSWLEVFLPEADRERVREAFPKVREGSAILGNTNAIRTKDGRLLEIEWHSTPLTDSRGGLTGLVAFGQDITERKRSADRIAQLSRVQAILGDMDRAILRISDRQRLLDEFCRIAVERAGFKLAWIGMVRPDGKVRPVAKYGATGYLRGIRIVTQDVPLGHGPVGTAIRQNRPVAIDDVDRDSRMAPWRRRAIAYGLRYVAAFPIQIGGKVAGAFQVYAPRANFFDQSELNLLTQVSNEISFALTAISDATARKEAEAALRESNTFNQQIIAGARDGIIVYSRDLKYLSWNPFMEELTGLPATDVIGRHPLQVFPFLSEKRLIQRLQATLEGDKCCPLDFHYLIPRTGRSGWVSDSNAPLRSATGEIIGVIGIVRDITERKQAEDSLRRSEQNLTEFFNHAPIGLQWLSASGNVLRANRSQLDLLGYVADEYLGRFFGDFCADPAVPRDLLERLAANETVKAMRLPLRRKDGAIRVVLVDAQPLWYEGQFLYSSVFSRDITERVNLERELLEIGERERRRIAQDLHDGLGQLLVGTAFLGDTLRHELARRSPPEARKLDRLLEVLREAITQTRSLARGLHPVKPEPEGLMVALEELARRTSSLFRTKCKVICPLPVLIEDGATATHLYRIAQEAVTNAVKHGKPSRIQIHLFRTQEGIYLKVKDNGSGLLTMSRKGEGMGLRIMRHRAGAIGGTLTVQRRSGGGTTVVCTVNESAGIREDRSTGLLK